MKVFRALLSLVTVLVVTGVQAGRLHVDDSNTFEYSGIIDVIEADRNRLIIDDNPLGIADYVIVHKGSKGSIDVHDLRSGMNVGYSTRSGKNRGEVVEVWILPDNYPRKMR